MTINKTLLIKLCIIFNIKKSQIIAKKSQIMAKKIADYRKKIADYRKKIAIADYRNRRGPIAIAIADLKSAIYYRNRNRRFEICDNRNRRFCDCDSDWQPCMQVSDRRRCPLPTG